LREATDWLQLHSVTDAMQSFAFRIMAVLMISAPLLIFSRSTTSAATVTVTIVGNYYNFSFSPRSVTIHRGDTVRWTWNSIGHSTTSGSPGMPNGLWDSGIRNQGAMFTYTFNNAGSFPYYCTRHGACCGMAGTVTVLNSNSTPTPTPTPAVTSYLGNISTRGFVQTADNVMIGGFIVQGTEPKRVIIRAIGRELIPFGVPNVLGDPTLDLHNGAGALIASNNNWQTTIIGGIITGDQVSAIQNSGHAPTDPSESAIIATLPPGNYTAIVRGINSSTGNALVEGYDLSPENISILENISTREFVQTGDNVMIGGFIVQGSQAKRVILRAIGPELTPFGVPDVLADPTLELHNGAGALIASNNNWQTTIIGGIITADQVSAIQNSGHAPTQPSESAIIATLPPGNYTAIVRGVNNTTGNALVEVYDLQPVF
jgi:plastocyanin